MLTRGLAIVIALAALWALWWPVTAWREEARTADWLDRHREAGWQAEAQDISVSGFPLSYKRRIEEALIADPASGWAWQGDLLTLERARHPQLSDAGLRIVWPETQSLRTPYRRLDITADKLEAVLLPAQGSDILAAAQVDLDSLRASTDDGAEVQIAAGSLRAVARPETPQTVSVELSMRDVTPPGAAARALARSDLASDRIERIAAEGEVSFDKPWTLTALDSARPQPTRLQIRDAGVQWGELMLRVAGELDIDATGMAEGELLVKATNWREILSAAQDARALSEPAARALETALNLASRLAGSPTTLDIPLRFTDGRVRLGPVPLGPAPVFRLP